MDVLGSVWHVLSHTLDRDSCPDLWTGEEVTDRITTAVENMFDDIDSVDLRVKLRRKSRKLSSRCPDCEGRGERWVGSKETGAWFPCDTCHPERVVFRGGTGAARRVGESK